MSDIMEAVGDILRGPLTPDPSNGFVEYFNGLEEDAKKVVADPELLAKLHHGFEIFRLASHFDYKDANIPQNALLAMHEVTEFFMARQLSVTLHELGGEGLDPDDLANRFRLMTGIGTIMGYLSRALEVDGRWPTK